MSAAVTSVTRHTNNGFGKVTKVSELSSSFSVSRPNPRLLSGCYFPYLLSSVSPLTSRPSTRAHPQLRWIRCSSAVTLTQTLQLPALLPLTTCPTTAPLLTLNLHLTWSRLGTFSTIPTTIQLFIIPGSNITRFPTPTREVLLCKSSTTPIPFAQIYPTFTTSTMLVSILHGLTCPGLPTIFRLPSLLILTNGTTRP